MKKLIPSRSRHSVLLQLALIIGVAISAIAFQSYAAVFTQPTMAPPGGNIAGPINTGLNPQAKAGKLTIGVPPSSQKKPLYSFRVFGNSRITNGLLLNQDGAPNGLFVYSGNVIVNNGNVGIGVSKPKIKLDVGGEGHFSGALTVSGAFTAVGQIRSYNDLLAPIFRDADNASYYVDPASGSSLNSVTLHGTLKFQDGTTQNTAAATAPPFTPGSYVVYRDGTLVVLKANYGLTTAYKVIVPKSGTITMLVTELSYNSNRLFHLWFYRNGVRISPDYNWGSAGHVVSYNMRVARGDTVSVRGYSTHGNIPGKVGAFKIKVADPIDFARQ